MRRVWASSRWSPANPLRQAVAAQALLTRGPQWVDSSMILCLLTSAFGLTKMSSTPVK